jgi:hypothetical protein
MLNIQPKSTPKVPQVKAIVLPGCSGGARHKQQQGPMTMSTEKVRKEIELQEPQSLY